MRSIQGRIGWTGVATFFSAAVMAAGLSFGTAPAQAAFELPEGEKITNVPAIPRAIPQKEAYELYEPKIGKNFDLKNFWLRADLRVRPEMRNGVCFGEAAQVVAFVTRVPAAQRCLMQANPPMTSLFNSGCGWASATTSRRT